MKVTISDVARLAGVSTATVSHTINHTRYVSEETREKVCRAIAELGYTPDVSARSFRTGKKKTVGFVVPDISNSFFSTMIEAAENYLSAHGYHLIISNTKEAAEREARNIRLLSAGLVDGLVVASTMEDCGQFEQLIPAGFPLVLVDRTFEENVYPSVSVSNFQPIYRGVCRLAAKGNTRIGIIGGLPRLSSTKERISAYLQAIEDCGLPRNPDLIRFGTQVPSSAYGCLDELLAQNCDAVIVSQGLMATDTLMYLHEKGIRLVKDIDLVSFSDSNSSVYTYYSDRMDCIVQPVEELGRAAGEQILSRIQDPAGPIFQKVLNSVYQPYDVSDLRQHSDR